MGVDLTKSIEQLKNNLEISNYSIEKELRHIIREKLNFKILKPENVSEDETGKLDWKTTDDIRYDQFHMSGYNNAFYHNLEILSRFRDYSSPIHNGDWRESKNILPVFSKGWGGIFEIRPHCGNKLTEIECVSGEATDDIIFKTLILQNPTLLEDMENEKKIMIEELFTDIPGLIDEKGNETVSKAIIVFKRNIPLIKELKKKIRHCQLCEFTFKKKNGENYNEVHHIIPLSENGKDQQINTLIVCANCHRQLHYANIDISNIQNREIIINGEKKTIK